MTAQEISEAIIEKRVREAAGRPFLNPNYDQHTHDPYLLPDMNKAVSRLARAKKDKEQVCVYGDYDIDGISASAVLSEAFGHFGITTAVYIPNRFDEGYGLNKAAIESIAADGAQLIVTVDCGSLSVDEVARATELGIDVIITDHHEVGAVLPRAVAVINPHRSDSAYPFKELAGVGVAFKLVQACQKKISGIQPGGEKWLLDLVALGTVCDVVDLVDENRVFVHWGLEVMRLGRRPGVRALVEISGASPLKVSSTDIAFRLGPRLNAAGRLGSPRLALELLQATRSDEAQEKARQLEELNSKRKSMQTSIFNAAEKEALESDDPVLVVAGEGWSQGVIGIVAAKLLEKFKRPAFVFDILGETAKGSARSFGDFHLSNALNQSRELLIRGGGHAHAAGCTIARSSLPLFRDSLNAYWRSLKLDDQAKYLVPEADVQLTSVEGLNIELIDLLAPLEPFGHANPAPTFQLAKLRMKSLRRMGDGRHCRIEVEDSDRNQGSLLCFNRAQEMSERLLPGQRFSAWVSLERNEFNGRINAELQLIDLVDGSLA